MLHNNWIVEPKADTPPRAIVHFLGGAFAGAVPQLAYASLINKIAQDNYIVVATPYALSFDYAALCDNILDTLEPAYDELAERHGPLPLIGVGHSAGALLHTIICSAFRGTGGVASVPRAANVLISYNNKRAADAIPLFGEVVGPVASSLLEMQSLARAAPAASAGLDLLGELRRRLTQEAAPAALDRLGTRAITAEAAATAATPPAAEVLNRTAAELTAVLAQLLPVADQIEPLLREIDRGATEFEPPPAAVRDAASRLYGAGRTLVLQFDNDTLDESDEIVATLGRASGVRLTSRRGTHLTPLQPTESAPLPELASAVRILKQTPLASVGAAAWAPMRAAEADFGAAASTILAFLDASVSALVPEVTAPPPSRADELS